MDGGKVLWKKINIRQRKKEALQRNVQKSDMGVEKDMGGMMSEWKWMRHREQDRERKRK